MSRCVSLISEMRIFRLTEHNNILLFATEFQKRYKSSALRAAFVYFWGKTSMLLVLCNYKACALPVCVPDPKTAHQVCASVCRSRELRTMSAPVCAGTENCALCLRQCVPEPRTAHCVCASVCRSRELHTMCAQCEPDTRIWHYVWASVCWNEHCLSLIHI